MLYYAGIGSRETPTNVLYVMTKIAEALSDKGYTLRSGGAIGADTAFETGAENYDTYQARGESAIVVGKKDKTFSEVSWKSLSVRHVEFAIGHVALFHPMFFKLSNKAKMIHARNTFQVTGIIQEEKSRFVICWTSTGNTTKTNIDDGGTGQAMRIATHYDIPIYNLFNEENIYAASFVDKFVKRITDSNNTNTDFESMF